MTTANLKIEPVYGLGNSSAIESYKVIDEYRFPWFIGTKPECKAYIRLMNR